jgi:paraquat-inducible protein A
MGEVLLRGCPCCAHVQRLPGLAPGEVACCVHCGLVLADTHPCGRRNAQAWHAAVAALVLFPVAVSQPILRIERLGRAHESSVWAGSLGLVSDGKLALGLLVFACSIVLPLVKLLALVVLLRRPHALPPPARARAWRALELVGRFGMLDVLLVSVLVAWLELGSWVTVESGPAALAFACCVGFSLLASAWFDPHALWTGAEEEAVSA